MFIICSQRKSVACLLAGMIIYQLTKNHAIKISDDVTETRRSKILLYAPQTPLKGHPLRHLIITDSALTALQTFLLYYCTCLKWTPRPTNIVPLVSLLTGFNCTSQIKFNNYI